MDDNTKKRGARRLLIHTPVDCSLLAKEHDVHNFTRKGGYADVAAGAAASCWLSLQRPMAYEARRRLAETRRMTHIPGSQKQNQCAWSSLGEAWRSRSFSLLQGSDGSSLADVLCCIREDHPCASLEQLGSHRGIAISEA
jgi:hypothetical protein